LSLAWPGLESAADISNLLHGPCVEHTITDPDQKLNIPDLTHIPIPLPMPNSLDLDPDNLSNDIAIFKISNYFYRNSA
jgi:hypothetical protein